MLNTDFDKDYQKISKEVKLAEKTLAFFKEYFEIIQNYGNVAIIKQLTAKIVEIQENVHTDIENLRKKFKDNFFNTIEKL